MPSKNQISNDLLKKIGFSLKSLGIISIAKRFIALVIVCFIAYKISPGAAKGILVLIISELTSSVMSGVLGYKLISTYVAFDSKYINKYIKEITSKTEKVKFQCSLIQFTFFVIALGLIFFLDKRGPGYLSQELFSKGFVKITFQMLLGIFFLLRVLELITAALRLKLVKNIDLNHDWANIDYAMEIIKKISDLVKFVPGFGLFIFIVLYLGIPNIVVLPFVGIYFLMIIIGYASIKKMQKVDFNALAEKTGIATGAISNGETIIGSFPNFQNGRGGSYSIQEIGKARYPENSLLITNKRLLFIQVPMPGGDNIIGDMKYQMQNYIFNQEEMKRNLKELMTNNDLNSIYRNFGVKSIKFSEISNINIKPGALKIQTKSGEKHHYMFLDRDYVRQIKSLLRLK